MRVLHANLLRQSGKCRVIHVAYSYVEVGAVYKCEINHLISSQRSLQLTLSKLIQEHELTGFFRTNTVRTKLICQLSNDTEFES